MLSYTTMQSLTQFSRTFFDVLIMWLILYYAIKIVRNNSRTVQIFKGIILVVIIKAGANIFGLKTVGWMADTFVTYGFLAVIIIFQPEIRSLLEKLGKSNVFSRISTLSGNEKEALVDELVKATMLLAQEQTGALICLEQGHSLNDYIKTGTPINSVVTAELLTSIFVTSTPLHDGAVIIQGDRIACASAYFPPTNLELPSRYGARHRAAIGISEVTDSVTIVVSEETGRISIAEEGKLIRVDKRELRDYLLRVVCNEEKELKSKPLVKKDEIKSFFAPNQTTTIEHEEVIDVEGIEEPKRKTGGFIGKMAIKKQSGTPIESEEIKAPAKEQPLPSKGFFGIFKKKDEKKSMESLEKEEMDIKLPKKKAKKDKEVEAAAVETHLNEVKSESLLEKAEVEEKLLEKTESVMETKGIEDQISEEKPKRKARKTNVKAEAALKTSDDLTIKIKAASQKKAVEVNSADAILDEIHLEFSAANDDIMDDLSTDFKITDEDGSVDKHEK